MKVGFRSLSYTHSESFMHSPAMSCPDPVPDSKAIPVVARAPPTQIFQIPVENTKILKHFHLISIIKLGEIISKIFSLN